MSIYSNDNISKIAKLTPRELPHLAKTTEIMAYTVSHSYLICCSMCLSAKNEKEIIIFKNIDVDKDFLADLSFFFSLPVGDHTCAIHSHQLEP